MDAERERIQADLRGILQGEVLCDDVHLQLYATDASLYQVRPLGIVRPQHTADVVACVKYAAERRLPLHARGAGTGLAGESLGPGLILDFAHSMRQILDVQGDTVRIQPGVVHARLNRFLAPLGRCFGPDPALSLVTTMGSVLALDAAGSHWLRYGSARSKVVSMQVVLADGTLLEARRCPVSDSGQEAGYQVVGVSGPGADSMGAPGGLLSAFGTTGSGAGGLAAAGLSGVPGSPGGAGSSAGTAAASGGSNLATDLPRRLAELLRREAPVIAAHQPRSLVNRSGYHLQDVLEDGQLDLARLLVGSEGTLALITEATVKTDPLPKATAVGLLFFDRLEAAARAAAEAVRMGTSACDLMDRRLLSIARETDASYARLIPPSAEAMLLIETMGDRSWDVRERLRAVIQRLHSELRMAFDYRIAATAEELDWYWRLTNQVVARLYSLRGESRPLPFVEDFAVPPETLPDFITRLQNVLKSHQVTATLFGHAGHGQLHVRPFLDVKNAGDVRRMRELAQELYQEVMAVGGTISGEHGDGLSRSWFLPQQYGPLYDVFRAVKNIFDPQNILNPGKVVAELPQPVTSNLRPTETLVRLNAARSAADLAAAASVAATAAEAGSAGNEASDLSGLASEASSNPAGVVTTGGAGGASGGLSAVAAAEAAAGAATGGLAGAALSAAPLVQLELRWSAEELEQTVNSCNGCGGCRTQAPDARMCPIFRFQPHEEASPRAKANLLRGILSGGIGIENLAGEGLKAVADLCVNCHQCRLECPANVDIPKVVLETKAQYVAASGLPWSDWLFTRLDALAAWGSWLRPLANWSLGNRQARWVLEKFFGLSRLRKLPRLERRSFLRVAQRQRWTRSTRHEGRRVLYFADTFANWFDTSIAEATVRVLKHNGVAVFVHPDLGPSGMAAITAGDVERVLPLVRDNIKLLAEAVRQGYTIVTSEPSTALCLTREYPHLVDDDDARLVAANTSEVCAYLWRLHESGKLELDFEPLPLTVGYHLPCHTRAVSQDVSGQNLLRLIPGLMVRHLDHGCSGMAGTYGLKRDHVRGSLRAGRGLIRALRDDAIIIGSTECSACKVQMRQGTTKPTVHPIKLLAVSYGLLPDSELTTDRHESDLVMS